MLAIHKYRLTMFKYDSGIALLFLLTISMASFGQNDLIYETRLQSNIFPDNLIGVVEKPTIISYNNSLTDIFSLEMGNVIGSSKTDIATLNNEKKTFPKNIISLKIGADDPWVGITYERLLTQHLGTEVQVGLLGASLGPKIYFPGIRNERMNFYVGALLGWGMGGQKTYFPIGINVLTKNNFRFSLDAGPRIWHKEGEDNFLGFSLKIGKGF